MTLADAQPRYHRVLLKLSGEALAPAQGTGIDLDALALIAQDIKEVAALGVELAMVIERMTAGGALYGLPTPRIAPGEPANVTLVDLAATWEVGAHGYASRSANCCFHGRSLHGRVVLTVAAGALAFRAPMLAEAGLPA